MGDTCYVVLHWRRSADGWIFSRKERALTAPISMRMGLFRRGIASSGALGMGLRSAAVLLFEGVK